MKKNLDFNQNNIIKVQNESVKGILIDINPKDATPSNLGLNDLNKANLKIVFKKSNGNEVKLFNGRLMDYLVARFTQTMIFENAITQYADGFKLIIPFVGTIAPKGKEELVIELEVTSDVFAPGLVPSNSTFEFETIPSLQKFNTVLPVVDVYTIGAGEESISESIGNSVQRIVLGTDFDENNDYTTSGTAKVKEVSIEANGKLVKQSTENVLFAENVMLLNDVDWSPRNLVLFQANTANEILNAVTVKAQLKDAQSNSDTRILVVRAIQF